MTDFDVCSEKDRIVLVGHLVDSTNLTPFQETLATASHINFSRLYSVSWLGLQKLFTAIGVPANGVELLEIPSQVYRIVLVFPGLGDHFIPMSFQVETLLPDATRARRMTTMEELVSLSMDQGAFVKFADGARVLGSLTHLCRPFFRSAMIPSVRNLAPWPEANQAQALFWYDYVFFVRTILETSAMALRATTLLIEDALQQVLMRIIAAQQAWKVLEPEFKDPRSRTLLAMLPAVQEISQKTFTKLVEKCDIYDVLARQMEGNLLGESDTSFHNLVAEISTSGTALTSAAEELDSIGFDLGQKVFSFSDLGTMRALFEGVDAKKVEDKSIPSIRRKMKLAAMENATWDQTLNDITQEFKIAQSNLDRCIVALQGFDLIRQVIEHRIHEAGILQQDFPGLTQGELAWQYVQDHILDAAFEKLVTDQEKHSFTFFFPERENRHKNKLAPGDVAFF